MCSETHRLLGDLARRQKSLFPSARRHAKRSQSLNQEETGTEHGLNSSFD